MVFYISLEEGSEMQESLNYNFFNTLIFSGIIYGLIFSIFMFVNIKFTSLPRNFLIATILCLTLSNLQYWLIDVGFREKYNVPKIIYIQFELLIVPFFYLFIQSYLQKRVTNKLVSLTLLPFLLGMTYQFFAYSHELPRPLLRKYNLIAEIATITYSLLLISLIFFEIHKYEKSNTKIDFKRIGISTKWLKYSIYAAILIFAFWILSTQVFYAEDEKKLKVYYPLWISISIIIYWMGNKGIIELRIYHERKTIRKRYSSSNNKNREAKKVASKGDILFQQFLSDLQEERLYLNPNLSLDQLSQKYHVSTGYMSQVISKYSEVGLTELVNKLRIQEAQKMLLDSSFDNYTIESIALESGFSTKTNFYKVFKKRNGITPNQYKKVHNL